MVRDVRVPLELQIDGFFNAATVLTTNERSNLAFFFFEFEVNDFMVDDVRIGIFLKAGCITFDYVCARCDLAHDGTIHTLSSLLSCLEAVDVF